MRTLSTIPELESLPAAERESFLRRCDETEELRRFRSRAQFLARVGMLCGAGIPTGYLYWALHRLGFAFTTESRPGPYPDQWLVQWAKGLEAAHPASPGIIKIDGEIPRIEFFLQGWRCLSGAVTFICLARVLTSRSAAIRQEMKEWRKPCGKSNPY